MTKEQINAFIAEYIKENCTKNDSYEASAEREYIAVACKSSIDWAVKKTLDQVCDYLKGLKFQPFAGAPEERLISDEDIRMLRLAVEK